MAKRGGQQYYKVYQNKSRGHNAYDKWLACATVTPTIDLDKLAEHMLHHATEQIRENKRGYHLKKMIAPV